VHDPGFDHRGLKQMDAVLGGYVDRDEVPGLVWLVARHGEVHAGWAGVQDHGETTPVTRDAIFRIASMTKPVVAAAAMTYVEECTLRLDDPIDPWLPELADRRVLVDPAGPLDDTVPAERPITLRDVLTFRLGYGMDFGAFATGARQTQLDALAELGLPPGPPSPQHVPPADEVLRRLGSVPLAHQPGARWLYNTGSDVLGVLLERASGRSLPEVLSERVFEPLGMVDTGFAVPPAGLARFGSCHCEGPEGPHSRYDERGGQWATAPAFASGGGGLVSTVDDYHAFAEMLLAGGTHRGARVLSAASVALMTSDQLTAEQRRASGLDPSGAAGWGFGVGVQTTQTGVFGSAGTYGWTGGLGSSWSTDPSTGVMAILLTNQMFSSPALPPVHQDLLTTAAAALA
jgi:CubicO group peptidase (beta-lactamase class C family)